MRGFLPLIALLLIGCCGGCRAEKHAMELSGLAPREVAGWRASGEDQHYDRQSIFNYIDGAGEVYLQYAYRVLLVREFRRDGAPGIDLQIFDMDRPEEAFGIFSFEREDEEAGIGQDSEYAAGLLRFWKGRFFVCVSAEEEAPGVREAVFGLGRAIARSIPEEGRRPALLAALPAERLVPTGVRYFHGPFCLAYHYPLSGGNPLGLGPGTEAVLASYDPHPGNDRAEASGRLRVILVRYEAAVPPAAAMERLSTIVGSRPDPDGAATMTNGRWAAARAAGRMLAVVFEAPSREEALDLIGAVMKKSEGAPWTM